MLGAVYDNGTCHFTVWAPHVQRMDLHLMGAGKRILPMRRAADGTHSITVQPVEPGTLYMVCLDQRQERPDPASRHQPHGVHGPSAVVDPSFAWSDQTYHSPAFGSLVIYELHVGTFSKEGTFDSVIPHLDRLRDLGVNAIELMPVAQFPGARNWGYDGVYPYAVHDSYGGLPGLQRLVNACHERGMAIILDVVYNHLGPEGNYIAEYGPYFTSRHTTPWGDALNFDGPDSDQVRRFFIDSARFLIDACHIDGFRIDAVHAIVDTSARPFLQELAAVIHYRCRARGLPGWVIGESDLNDPRVLLDPAHQGFGMDAQWADDFHHAVHAYLTAETQGYYQDFGTLAHVATAYSNGFVYTGQYSHYRRRSHGSSPVWCTGEQFVVCTQNHDQVGNRARGDRLSASLSHDQQKLLACLLLLSPYVPLLFMGQEYGETAPFCYFTSHGDPELAEAVRAGRQSEFAEFGWPPQDIPDPQAPATFMCSQLDRSLMDKPQHRELWYLHQRLIHLRRSLPALMALDRERTRAVPYEGESILWVHRFHGGSHVIALFDLRKHGESRTFLAPFVPGTWRVVLDTSRDLPGGADPVNRADSPSTIDIPVHGSCVSPVALAPSSCLVFAMEHS